MLDRNLMKLPGMRPLLAALVILALLQAALIAGQAFSLSGAVGLLWEGAGITAAAPYLAAFAACFALLQLARFAQEAMLDRTSQDRAQELRGRLLERTFDPDILLAREIGAARLTALAADGVDEVQTYLRIVPPKVIGMAAISLPLLACEYAIDWPSGVILTVMYPVIIFFMVLLGRQAADHAQRQYASYTRLTNRFMDTLRGLGTIKSFGASEHEARLVHDQSEGLRVATVKTLRTATLSSAVLDLCATFGVAAVAIMLAFRLMDGSLVLTTGLVALVLAPEYFAPIRSFASDYHASLDGKNALQAILDALADRDETAARADDSAEAPGGSESAPNASARGSRGNDPQPAWTCESTLQVRGLGFSYDGEHPALPRTTFQVSGCRKVGIVGASGSGKSTLASILAGFAQPSCGTVSIDGAPADLCAEAWKARVRYIPQNPSVFRMSLADNVRFYNPQADDQAVRRAIESVGLAPLAALLPDGPDTMIGEGFRGLSGGEAHRVALARVLLDDRADVLVFDEPTAHLDLETELELKQPMLQLMEGRLVFFATHRLHWMDDMDCIVRLVGERATFQEVIA